MKRLLCGLGLLVAAGCGSDGNARAVTPVLADTRGTYRLAASSETTTDSGGVSTFQSYSAGTLRLGDSSYSMTIGNGAQRISHGDYAMGTSVNTILNSRHGAFSLTSGEPPASLTGNYEVVGDFQLTLDYHEVAGPAGSRVTRSETWIKESDSPRF